MLQCTTRRVHLPTSLLPTSVWLHKTSLSVPRVRAFRDPPNNQPPPPPRQPQKPKQPIYVEPAPGDKGGLSGGRAPPSSQPLNSTTTAHRLLEDTPTTRDATTSMASSSGGGGGRGGGATPMATVRQQLQRASGANIAQPFSEVKAPPSDADSIQADIVLGPRGRLTSPATQFAVRGYSTTKKENPYDPPERLNRKGVFHGLWEDVSNAGSPVVGELPGTIQRRSETTAAPPPDVPPSRQTTPPPTPEAMATNSKNPSSE
ncbi:hypothetical protein QOT17_009339 [Balamuthia mandrillaris]